MSTSENTSNTNTSSPGWCFVCNISLSPETANEHFESRTHLNRCLQKGIGISVVPSSERSSSWCSICNHALENTSSEQHYQSRAHLNKCLQKGVGIPLSYATSAAIIPPAAPRFTQAGVPTSPQGGATGCFPSGGFTSFRPGMQRVRPRTFQQGNKQMTFGGKKFPIQQSIICGQTQSNPQMSVPYSAGYGQEMRPSDVFRQYDSSWQSQSSAKNGWPYCDTCDQRFQNVGALSQHYSTSSHMEMKNVKQSQFHGCHVPGTVDQSQFYHNTSGYIQAQGQSAYFANQQEPFRSSRQNPGTHYVPKEWRPFNRPVQHHS